MQVGSVFAELKAKVDDFNSKMSGAGKALDDLGSKGKRLQDQLKNLERQKQLVVERMAKLEQAGQQSSFAYQNLANRAANLSDRLATQKMRMQEVISANQKGSKTFELLQGSVDGFKNSLSVAIGLATTAVAVIGALVIPIGLLGGAAIKAADDYQQSFIAFETMLGSQEQAGKIMKQLIELNKETPFELPDLLEQAKLLKGFGMETEKLVDTIKYLGDIASGVGKDKLPLIALALGQVKTAGKLTGNELRQFTENGVPLLEELTKVMGMSAEEIKAQMEKKGGIKPTFEQVETALRNLTKEGGRFYNLSYKLSQTFTGRISNIKDTFGSVLRGIAGISEETGEVIEGSLFDRATKGAFAFMKWLDANKQTLIEFGQAVFDALGKAIDQAKQIGKALGQIDFGRILNSKAVIEAQKQFQRFNTEVIKPITEYVKNNFEPTFREIGRVFAQEIAPKVQLLSEKVRELNDIFGPVFMPVLKAIGVALVAGLFGGLILVIKGIDLMVGAAIWLANSVKWVVDTAVGAWNWLGTAFNQVTSFFKQDAGTMAQQVGYFLGKMARDGKTQLENLFNQAKEILINLPTTIKDGFLKSMELLNQVANQAKDNFMKVWDQDWGQIGKDIINGIVKGLKDNFDTMKKQVSGLVEGLKKGFTEPLGINSPSKVFEGYGKNVVEGYVIGVEDNQIQAAQASAGMASMSAGATQATVNQTNSFNINGSQNPQAIVQEVVRYLSRQNTLAGAGLNLAG